MLVFKSTMQDGFAFFLGKYGVFRGGIFAACVWVNPCVAKCRELVIKLLKMHGRALGRAGSWFFRGRLLLNIFRFSHVFSFGIVPSHSRLIAGGSAHIFHAKFGGWNRMAKPLIWAAKIAVIFDHAAVAFRGCFYSNGYDDRR
ncbi:MAG: hypothetical protein JXB10_12490, partial [Pirellulales bacterium]|nr:hypothetical protein [Pirellulales bacterium]